ncbi:deoxynucleotidyltransferase terminal-interacting protein 2 [Neosynchiropus ocellatus]
MVATRRGGRVSSPSDCKSDEIDVQATPSSRRITRRTVLEAEGSTKSDPEQDGSRLERTVEKPVVSSPESRVRRCTRSSRLHSPEHCSTPVGSVHEADESDLESCCSVVSNPEKLLTRSSRRRPARKAEQDKEETSELESCSSAVSAPQSSRSARSLRRLQENPNPAEKENPQPVTASVRRSQRKSGRTRTSTKPQPVGYEESDAESCTSVGSEQSGPVRRSTRTRRSAASIPIYLEEASDSSATTRSRRTRVAKRDADRGQESDSDGFESGPTHSLHNLRRGRSRGPRTIDSDSTDVHSPPVSPDRGTPCSSRASSGHSTGGVSRQNCQVLERAAAHAPLNDSVFEMTVISEAADSTVVEEDEDKTLEAKDIVVMLEDAAAEEGPLDVPEKNTDQDEEKRLTSETSEAALTMAGQQEELSAGERPVSEMEDMQETAPSSEPSGPASVVVSDAEKTEGKEELMETAEELVQGVDDTSGSQPYSSPEEEVDVSGEAEPVTVPLVPEQIVSVDSDAEQQQNDVVIQKSKAVSLLDSSDDEYSEEELQQQQQQQEEDEDEDEDEEVKAQTSNKSKALAESVNGLFMIDTRPGGEADDDYYQERGVDEVADRRGKEDEEKMSEEDSDDDDDDDDEDDEDDDTQFLFASRDPQVKELSSRIDPGIRVKDLGGLYINFDGGKSKPASSSWQKLKEKKSLDEVMKKSVMGADFEKKEAAPPYMESKRKLKAKNKAEREKSTGDAWFNMKAPELTKELKDDLHLLKIRGSLDPKRFYKKNDRDGFPKYFQVGTVVGNPADYYHSHIPKKQRKRTMVEELLADAEFRQANKKRYQQILTEKAAQAAGKRNKKKFLKKRT